MNYEFKTHFSTFVVLNMDIQFNICFPRIKMCTVVHNIPLEGIMSQNLDLGPSFNFMTRNGKLFVIFSKLIFKTV